MHLTAIAGLLTALLILVAAEFASNTSQRVSTSISLVSTAVAANVTTAVVDNKYFHEPSDDDLGHHYDVRFFQGFVKNVEQQEALRHLIRSYLMFSKQEKFDTWLAHGTLLGWHWNGKVRNRGVSRNMIDTPTRYCPGIGTWTCK